MSDMEFVYWFVATAALFYLMYKWQQDASKAVQAIARSVTTVTDRVERYADEAERFVAKPENREKIRDAAVEAVALGIAVSAITVLDRIQDKKQKERR